MALNLWSVSAIRWRHLLRFETVFRPCDCGLTCGVPDFRDQSARARGRGGSKVTALLALDRAPQLNFYACNSWRFWRLHRRARALWRNGFARREGGAVVEERAHCFARAHARDVRKTPLPDFCANLSESVLGGMVRVA